MHTCHNAIYIVHNLRSKHENAMVLLHNETSPTVVPKYEIEEEVQLYLYKIHVKQSVLS